MPLTVIVVVCLAVVAARACNRNAWRPRQAATPVAGTAGAGEATATPLLLRDAGLVRSPARRDSLHQEVVCYATSVIHQERPAMADRRVSSVPTYGRRRSAARVSTSCARGATWRPAGRSWSARRRAAEPARRRAPLGAAVVERLMLGAVTITLGIIGVVTAADVGAASHCVIVVLGAIVFATALLLISDLDQP